MRFSPSDSGGGLGRSFFPLPFEEEVNHNQDKEKLTICCFSTNLAAYFLTTLFGSLSVLLVLPFPCGAPLPLFESLSFLLSFVLIFW